MKACHGGTEEEVVVGQGNGLDRLVRFLVATAIAITLFILIQRLGRLVKAGKSTTRETNHMFNGLPDISAEPESAPRPA